MSEILVFLRGLEMKDQGPSTHYIELAQREPGATFIAMSLRGMAYRFSRASERPSFPYLIVGNLRLLSGRRFGNGKGSQHTLGLRAQSRNMRKTCYSKANLRKETHMKPFLRTFLLLLAIVAAVASLAQEPIPRIVLAAKTISILNDTKSGEVSDGALEQLKRWGISPLWTIPTTPTSFSVSTRKRTVRSKTASRRTRRALLHIRRR